MVLSPCGWPRTLTDRLTGVAVHDEIGHPESRHRHRNNSYAEHKLLQHTYLEAILQHVYADAALHKG